MKTSEVAPEQKTELIKITPDTSKPAPKTPPIPRPERKTPTPDLKAIGAQIIGIEEEPKTENLKKTTTFIETIDGRQAEVSYHEDGKTVKRAEFLDGEVAYYDEKAKKTKEISPLGSITEYDANGNVIKSTKAEGEETLLTSIPQKSESTETRTEMITKLKETIARTGKIIEEAATELIIIEKRSKVGK